ncbi:hypothetical protein WHT83_25160 (plasmid) [Aminobacter sp. P9b]|uniref:hypothetical protein n=1 Tax=Aminobacter sp. P9b TaxID=3133697 RepID=UPI003251E7F2
MRRRHHVRRLGAKVARQRGGIGYRSRPLERAVGFGTLPATAKGETQPQGRFPGTGKGPRNKVVVCEKSAFGDRLQLEFWIVPQLAARRDDDSRSLYLHLAQGAHGLRRLASTVGNVGAEQGSDDWHIPVFQEERLRNGA